MRSFSLSRLLPSVLSLRSVSASFSLYFLICLWVMDVRSLVSLKCQMSCVFLLGLGVLCARFRAPSWSLPLHLRLTNIFWRCFYTDSELRGSTLEPWSPFRDQHVDAKLMTFPSERPTCRKVFEVSGNLGRPNISFSNALQTGQPHLLQHVGIVNTSRHTWLYRYASPNGHLFDRLRKTGQKIVFMNMLCTETPGKPMQSMLVMTWLRFDTWILQLEGTR